MVGPGCSRMKTIAALHLVVCVFAPAFAQSSGSFATDKKSCPPTGKGTNGVALKKTSDGGLRNMAKRHVPSGSTPA